MISKAALKSIKALKLKKYRTLERKFLVECIKSVNEVCKSSWEVDRILATEVASYNLSDKSKVEIVDEKQLRDLSQLSNNEDCLAVVKMKDYPSERDFRGITLVVDGLQDPGNLGTIVRTLDWFGYDQLICSSDTVDFYNIKTISASMGSFTRVIPFYTDLEQLFAHSSQPILGMDMNGVSIREYKKPDAAFIVMGSESLGIRPYLKPYISQSLTIPGAGNAESLNVAIATGMVLFSLANL